MDHLNVSMRKKISLWLLTMLVLIVAIISIGGYTRLSNAGLSMVSWHPINGTLPPLNQKEWTDKFNEYKKTPEFQTINYSINIKEFQRIFLIEYIHRVFGRLVFMLYVIPMLYFIFKKNIKSVPHIFILLLFLTQSIIGWYMVKSGLYKYPHVSPYRLCIHLLLALVIYVCVYLQLLKNQPQVHKKIAYQNCKLFLSIFALLLLFAQISVGALVSGLKAGLVYNTWPLMDEKIVPSEFIYFYQKMINSSFTNFEILRDHASMQFIHRILGYLVVFCNLVLSITVFNNYKIVSMSLIVASVAQIILGIFAVLLSVPVWLGMLHQFGAIVLISLIVYINYNLIYNNKELSSFNHQ